MSKTVQRINRRAAWVLAPAMVIVPTLVALAAHLGGAS